MAPLRLLLPGFALLFLATGCSSPTPYPQNPAVSDAQGTPRDTTTFYFVQADTLPPDYIPVDKRPDMYLVDGRVMDCKYSFDRASTHLIYFQAPVLSNHYLGADIYRFLWMRSFHRPVLLTLRHDLAGSTLRTQLLNKEPSFITYSLGDPNDFAPSSPMRARTIESNKRELASPEWQAKVAEGKRRAVQVTAQETTRPVTPEQWQHFKGLLSAAHFWEMPACKPQMMLDGASWLLEGHQASGYHTVLRQSPDSADTFRAACEYLLDLSSARNEERY